MRNQSCGKCGGSMAQGFLLQDAHGYHATAQWVEGAPIKSMWMGLKLRGKTKLAVETFRCGRCGFLESYAR